jgi:dihydrodipicolinate reductase
MLTKNNIPFINENSNMKNALKIITDKKLGTLIVRDKKGITKGIITDGQIRRMTQKNKNLYSLMGKKYLNKKSFPFSNKINFNSIRKGNVVGEHEVRFSSGKEIIRLNHESFDRALYSEGALTAAKWLMTKKPGLYSMRDLLNF